MSLTCVCIVTRRSQTLHYKRLLQNASHKMKVASWVDMSDSDSDSEDPDKDMHIAHLLR